MPFVHPLYFEFMTVRFFVASAGLLIFAWLAITYFLTVPMDSYARPSPTALSSVAGEDSKVAVTGEDTPSYTLATEDFVRE